MKLLFSNLVQRSPYLNNLVQWMGLLALFSYFGLQGTENFRYLKISVEEEGSAVPLMYI